MKFNILPQLKAYAQKLKPLAKHHYFIVMLVIFGGLAYGVYQVNQTLNRPTDDDYKAQSLRSTIGNKFNKSSQETVDKIKALQKSSDAPGALLPLPSGRINPFAE